MSWRRLLLTVGLIVGFFNLVGGQTTSSPLCLVPADMVFVLDSSGSVGRDDFNKTLDFVKDAVEKIHIGPDAINIGIVTFSHVGIVQCQLNDYSTKAEMLAAISAIPYSGGGTHIANGIRTMKQVFTDGSRNDTAMYGVIITDGKSSYGNAPLEADLARQANITMFALGVGSSFARRELEHIANKPSKGYVYNVTGYDVLTSLLEVILEITDCDNKTDLIGKPGEECTAIKRCVDDNSQCVKPSNAGTGICNCRPGYQLEIINGESQCVNASKACVLGEICFNSTNCIHNAECIYDGSNSAITRCLCKYGYVHAVHNGICQCAAVISTTIDPDCDVCETNGGVCYDTTGDQKKDGCVCPSFKCQPDCQKSYVSVMCNLTTFTMTVCYEEQPQYQTDGAVVLVEGQGLNHACTARKVTTQNSSCPLGQHQLVLPLAESQRTNCDTKKFLYDTTTMRYQNTILVKHHVIDIHPDDVTFRAFCSYDSHSNVRFDPIGVAVAAHERGEHHHPNLTFYVENNLGYRIPTDKAIRLGDKISFRIQLLRDGTYTALRVLQCMASSKPTIPDPSAVTLPLVVNSCPSPGQNHITDQNNWRLVSGKTNELRAGQVRMFKLSDGNSIHLHCMVQLCLVGSEGDCGKVNCTHPAGHASYGRRKRSTSTIFRLSRTLSWYDTKAKSLTKGTKDIGLLPSNVLGGILSVLGVSVIVFIAMVTSLIWKTRQSKLTNQSGSNR